MGVPYKGHKAHQDEHDKTKQEAHQHNGVDDRQPVDLRVCVCVPSQ